MSLADILAARKQQTATPTPTVIEEAAVVDETPHNGHHALDDWDGDLQHIISYYPTLDAVKADERAWKLLSLRQRLDLGKLYTEQAKLAAAPPIQREKSTPEVAHIKQETIEEKRKTFSLSIVLNEMQRTAVEFARQGKTFVLTGAAGTGKTTACREIARAFLEDPDKLGSHNFRVDGGSYVWAPGIAFCAYTRKATANIRRALHTDPELEEKLNINVLTIHKLLEYMPVFYFNAETGKDSMRFEPKRTAQNPLNVKVIVLEEASMNGLDLMDRLFDALREGTIIVYVGDINQLPPVFGKSIMNYALAQLPVVELTEVYRQALDSGIISNAHRVLKGEPPIANKDTMIVDVFPGMKVGQEKLARSLGASFHKSWEKGSYDPEQDIILSPWNKHPMGTTNMNNWIAQFLGEQRKAMVYEVIAGRRTMYLAVGDRVMYEKRDGIISKISHNGKYLGRAPQPAGTDLTRFGVRKIGEADAKHEDFDDMVAGYANFNVDEPLDEEKKLQASHVIDVELDDGEMVTLDQVGDFNEQVFSLGYVLTVHKAQGCEWRKVFLLLHEDHAMGGFLDRELLYTAITRARDSLVILAKQRIIEKAVKQQSIKGNTLQEKIAYINKDATGLGNVRVTK